MAERGRPFVREYKKGNIKRHEQAPAGPFLLLSLLHSALGARLTSPVSRICLLTSTSPFFFVLGLLHRSGCLQCQLHPNCDCHLHQPGPAVARAARPGLLRGSIPDQGPSPLWSPHPLGWGLLQGGSREDHDRKQSSEHWQEGQGGTGEFFGTSCAGRGGGRRGWPGVLASV